VPFLPKNKSDQWRRLYQVIYVSESCLFGTLPPLGWYTHSFNLIVDLFGKHNNGS